MSKRKMRKAKSCPFCGEKKKLQIMMRRLPKGHFIMCLTCLAEGPKVLYKGKYYINKVLSKSVSSSKSWTTRKWNKRISSNKLHLVERTDWTMDEILEGREGYD